MAKNLLKVFLLIGISIASVSCEIETRNITQWLDHFDDNNTATWENFYFIDESFYEPGGPIFLYIGDMVFYDTFYRLNQSHFRDIAEEASALLVGTQHRYYGDNHPVPDLSIENLVYLTSSQALEDVATLVRFLKSSSPDLENAKVIAAGVGHGGALATWMRQRYPELIQGAWASSAKLNAILNFGEFHANTATTVRIYGGQLCYDRMANAFAMLDQVYADRNIEKLIEMFHLCPTAEDLEDELNIGLFFGTLSTAIGQAVTLFHAPAITDFCGYLERGQDHLYGLADWIYSRVFQGQGCFPATVQEFLYIYLYTDWNADGNIVGGRQQVWQSCNEFGVFRSSNASGHPFGNRFPDQLFVDQCSVFLNETLSHEDIQSNVDNTNAQFGGLSPNVTRVYFTNGGLDSDRSLSVLQDLNPYSPANIIPYFGFGRDFASMEFTEYDGLRAVQERARFLILLWLWADEEIPTQPPTTEAPNNTTTTEYTGPPVVTTTEYPGPPVNTTELPPTTTTPFPEMTPYYHAEGQRQIRLGVFP